MKKLLYFFVAMLCVALCGCQQGSRRVVASSEEVIAIDESVDSESDTAYATSLQSTKQMLESELNTVIGTIPSPMRAARPESSLLNWSADALLEMARLKSGQAVDMSVVNIGGLRCEWHAGAITFREVFELMPFDNELVVLTLTGEDLLALAQCFADQGGQGMSGMRLEIRDGKATNVTLNGKKIVPQMLYRVATSDYLSGGNDHMEPLANYSSIWKSDAKIRDLYIEYITLHPVVEGKVDGRTKVI